MQYRDERFIAQELRDGIVELLIRKTKGENGFGAQCGIAGSVLRRCRTAWRSSGQFLTG